MSRSLRKPLERLDPSRQIRENSELHIIIILYRFPPENKQKKQSLANAFFFFFFAHVTGQRAALRLCRAKIGKLCPGFTIACRQSEVGTAAIRSEFTEGRSRCCCCCCFTIVISSRNLRLVPAVNIKRMAQTHESAEGRVRGGSPREAPARLVHRRTRTRAKTKRQQAR